MNSKSIKYWKISDIKEKLAEIDNLLASSFVTETKEGYQQLKRRRNRKLFALLDLVCFFDYHRSNVKKEVCYVHQVVKYIVSGWRNYIKDKYCEKYSMECHHLDHNPRNNHPNNLVYVTPLENKLLACIIGGWNYSEVVSYGMKNIRRNFHVLALSTIKKTFESACLSAGMIREEFTRYVENIYFHIDGVIEIIKTLKEKRQQAAA